MMDVVALALSTIVLGTPFLLAGIVVTLALTKRVARSASSTPPICLARHSGCVLVVPLLNGSNISSVAFVAGASAAGAAYCFHCAARSPKRRASIALTVVLLLAAVANATTLNGVRIVYPKNRFSGRATPSNGRRGTRIRMSSSRNR